MGTDANSIAQSMRPLIESGNASHLSCLLKQAIANGISAERLLLCRYEEEAVVKRPSTGRQMLVMRPTPLLLAAAGWFHEIVALLAESVSASKAALDAECSVKDDSAVVTEYSGVTALMLAAITGRQPFLQCLLSSGAAANMKNSLGDTPIYQASLEGHASIVESLIRGGAYLDLPNSSGITPLMIASFVGNTEVVELLLRYGARTQCTDSSGKNSLFYCVPPDCTRCFDLLLQAGATITAEANGTTLLMEAAYQGSCQLLQLLLARPEVDVNARDGTGRNALFYAIDGGCLEAFKLLLRAGVVPDAVKDASSRFTPLMAAALKYRLDFVEVLLAEADCDEWVMAVDARGRNAIFYCASNPNPDLLQLLLQRKLQLQPAADGSTFLMSCISARNWKLVQYLLQRLESLCPLQQLWAIDERGESALSLAVQSPNSHLLHQLVALGAKPDEHPPIGERRLSLLMLACVSGNADAALFLADTCGGVEELDGTGRNLLSHCVQGGHLDLLRHFSEQLQPVVASDGCSLLHDACAANRMPVLQFLLSWLAEDQWQQHDNKGRSLLFPAIHSNSAKILQQLLHQQHQPQLEQHCVPAVDSEGVTLLMHAMASGCKEARELVRQHRRLLQISDTEVDSEGRGLLFHAAAGEVGWEALEEALSLHPALSLNDTDAAGRTVLMHCILRRCPAVARQLLSRAEELQLGLHCVDKEADNALFCAVRVNDVLLSDQLLKLNLSPTSDKGKSSLALCYQCSHLDLANHLLQLQLHLTPELLNGGDDNGVTVFQHWASLGRDDLLQRHVASFDAALDSDAEGRSALLHAAAAGRSSTIAVCLEQLCCDAQRIDSSGRNALSHAVAAGSFDCCKQLLAFGVRALNKPTLPDGRTLLHLCAAGGCQLTFCHFLRFIVTDDAVLDAKDSSGATAAHLLSQRGLADALEAFRQRGGSFEGVADKRGRTPLMLASSSCSLPTLQLLLQHCSPTAAATDRDSQLRSCLHHACSAEQPSHELLRALLQAGADPLAADVEGRQALHLLVARPVPKAVRLLLIRGGDAFAQTQGGDNAFELCCRQCAGVMDRMFGLTQSQRAHLNSLSHRLAEADWLSMAQSLSNSNAILCRRNVQQLQQLQPKQRRRRLLSLVAERGATKLREFVAEVKKVDAVVAMEMMAGLFDCKPRSEFMV